MRLGEWFTGLTFSNSVVRDNMILLAEVVGSSATVVSRSFGPRYAKAPALRSGMRRDGAREISNCNDASSRCPRRRCPVALVDHAKEVS